MRDEMGPLRDKARESHPSPAAADARPTPAAVTEVDGGHSLSRSVPASSTPASVSASASAADLPPLTAFGAPMRALFPFAPTYRPLNHGSYGTFPLAVLEHRQRLQRDMEARECIYKHFSFPRLLREARVAVAPLLGAHADEVVLAPNASTGINTVLRNLAYAEGDVALCFSTVYPACLKTLQSIGETAPLRVHSIEAEYPIEETELLARFRAAVEELRDRQGLRVRLAIFDTITSLPGVRVPWEKLVETCRHYGILSLVDAAHGIGHIDMTHTGAVVQPDFLVTNCHKWLFVPRGCAVLYVPFRNQHYIATTLPTYHGYEPPAVRKVRGTAEYFTEMFVDVATTDTTPYLCIPEALLFRAEVCGGEDAIMAYCLRLAREGGDRVAQMLGTEVLDDRGGLSRRCSFANVRLPLEIRKPGGEEAGGGGDLDLSDAQAVYDWIFDLMAREYDTYFQIKYYQGAFWVRFSAQVYLSMEDFEWGAKTLLEICERVKRGEWKEGEGVAAGD